MRVLVVDPDNPSDHLSSVAGFAGGESGERAASDAELLGLVRLTAALGELRAVGCAPPTPRPRRRAPTWRSLIGLLAADRLRVPIARTDDWSKLNDVIADLRERRFSGKPVLTIS